MKKKSFDNAGLSPLKRSLAGKCLAYLGGLSVIRPMVAMLLITVLLSSTTVTKAQIKVPRETNKYIQIGAKVLGLIPNPIAKALGGGVGFLFAEEKLPEYEELKANLAKEWQFDIDEKSKENYKTFIDDRKIGYRQGLDRIDVYKRNNRNGAISEAQNLSTIVYTDIPLFQHNKGAGKPYPARASLPYLYAAMCLELDLLKMQIEWGQEEFSVAEAAGDTKAMTELMGRRDGVVEQYNKERINFWKTLQVEIVRAKKERFDMVNYWYEADGKGGHRFAVRDFYYGRETEGFVPNLKYYKHVERTNDTNRIDFEQARYVAGKTYLDSLVKGLREVSKETNAYDLADYGLYKTTSDKRAPIQYSCTERIKATRAGGTDPVVPSLHLVCPVPGGGVDELVELSSNKVHEAINEVIRDKANKSSQQAYAMQRYDALSLAETDETADMTKFLPENWDNYPPKGYLFIRNEDGSFDLGIERDPDVQTVTNTNDSGPGSLRQAIEDGGRINVYAIEGQTITLTSGPIFIYVRDVKINLGNIKPIKIVSSTNDMIFVITGDAKFDNGNLVDNLLDEKGQPMRCGKTPDGKAITCPAVVQ